MRQLITSVTMEDDVEWSDYCESPTDLEPAETTLSRAIRLSEVTVQSREWHTHRFRLRLQCVHVIVPLFARTRSETAILLLEADIHRFVSSVDSITSRYTWSIFDHIWQVEPLTLASSITADASRDFCLRVYSWARSAYDPPVSEAMQILWIQEIITTLRLTMALQRAIRHVSDPVLTEPLVDYLDRHVHTQMIVVESFETTRTDPPQPAL